MRFRDKVVVITGGASGMGFSAAQLFAAEGAIVAINDVCPEAVDAAVAAIKSKDGRAIGIPGDVSSLESVRENVREVISQFDRVNILVNNAGIFSVSRRRKSQLKPGARPWR